ncbi:hypothetical protein MmiAt1_07390 [Methanimicrococcus sp. At1]|uniref:Uncharacterized protein n=1 Tax=Methanimicrococcus hacksteinii TaxID=3028293 RepID=A0ABU3VP43_9EURY|nr:hypothetical protein [Methanimicrococcus sp. At1]MDV0445182.1 hypothetical protein [Methanimicrococcus sp. At1]
MTGLFEQSEKENNLVFIGFLLMLIFFFLWLPYFSFVIIFFGGLAYAVYSRNRFKSVFLAVLMLIIFFSYAFVAGLDQWPGLELFLKTLIPIMPFIIPYLGAVFFAAVGSSNWQIRALNYLIVFALIIYMLSVFLKGIN